MPSRRRRIRRKPKRVAIGVFAARLRKRMTKAEAKLWKILKPKMKEWGVVFEPQGIVCGRFIADFVCREKRLIVELDGSIHRLNRIKVKDKYRTAILEGYGFTVIRFNNSEVFNDVYSVLNKIRFRTAM